MYSTGSPHNVGARSRYCMAWSVAHKIALQAMRCPSTAQRFSERETESITSTGYKRGSSLRALGILLPCNILQHGKPIPGMPHAGAMACRDSAATYLHTRHPSLARSRLPCFDALNFAELRAALVGKRPIHKSAKKHSCTDSTDESIQLYPHSAWTAS